MKPSCLWTWQGCNVTLLPLLLSLSLPMPTFLSLFPFVHYTHTSMYNTTNWQTSRPYIEGCSQAPPIFNSDYLCYQALGLIFYTNIKLLHLKPLMTNLHFLWTPWSSGQLPDFPWTPTSLPDAKVLPLSGMTGGMTAAYLHPVEPGQSYGLGCHRYHMKLPCALLYRYIPRSGSIK